MPIIIDGKKISQEVKDEVRDEVRDLKGRGVVPKLVAVLVGEDPASSVYVRNKGRACEAVGMEHETINLPAATSQEDLLKLIGQWNEDRSVSGILVQLPLPEHIDEKKILYAISPEKDVDCFHPINVGKLMIGEPGFLPCTPAGVMEMMMRTGFDPSGKHAVIVGRSNIVGKPLAALLMQKQKGSNATVTVCHSRTPDIGAYTRNGDILIAAIGSPEFVTGDMVKPGAIVIDVGINRVEDAGKKSGYRLVGDVDYAAASQLAHAITPVPGGVGPMTIAMLLKNTLKAAVSQNNAL